LRNALVICQVALSFVLLIGAGLLARSFINLSRSDPGFARQSVVAAGLHFDWARYVTDQQRLDGYTRLLDKIRQQPGVIMAALASNFPLNPDAISNGVWMSVVRSGTAGAETAASIRSVTSDYFQTLDIPIVEGRAFINSEDREARKIAIVSKSLARRLWGEDSPIGKPILLGHQRYEATVAGVAGDVQELGPARGVLDEVYVPVVTQPVIGAVLIRMPDGVENPSELIRRAVREFDPATAVTEVQSLSQAHGNSIRLNRSSAELLGAFALLSFFIAISGVAGILTIVVGQRIHEIAIRIALGARPVQVLGMIASQGMKPVLIGIIFGWAGAIALTRVLQGQLFSVTPTDPPTYLAISLLLAIAALIACYVPARRAIKIDPRTALRAV
jgi:putative ABC transport system permease protein